VPTNQKLEISIPPDVSRIGRGRLVSPRNLLLASLLVISILVFLAPLWSLLALCISSAEYSYIALIPFVTLCLFFIERRRIFRQVHYSPGVGTFLILAGIAVASAGAFYSSRLGAGSELFLRILGLVVIWIGSFALCYGSDAARAGLFALLFTLLFVPFPHVVMAKPIVAIQHGSANVASFLFSLSGVPVFRSGLTFALPRLTVIVATECSGIHSATALFIATILVGHFFLKPAWQKGFLVLLVFPIISFTNGLRVFILSTLANYVDIGFMSGNLHRKGGIFFFALALLILALVTRLLRVLSRARKTSAQH
jgi:exosortase